MTAALSPDRAAAVCTGVAIALCLSELDRLHALERLPTPDDLLTRLRARGDDFSLIVGVTSAYLRERGIAAVHDGVW